MLCKMGRNLMKAKKISDGFITYQAIYKENIPRVYGYGETFVEAKNQCKLALDEYLLKKPLKAHINFMTFQNILQII